MLDAHSIASLDALAGALAARRVHILSGATGTGKTAVALRFIDVGLRRGERALLVTSLRPADLRSLAIHLRLDLEEHIADGRLVVLRHGRELTARLGRPGALHGAIDELRAATESVAPARVVIDSVAPFLADEGASAVVMSRLAGLLAALEATTLVTVPGQLGDSYDRRLEPLVQEAAAVLHLSREPQGSVSVDAVTLRASSFAPIPARILIGRPSAPATLPPAPADADSRVNANGQRLTAMRAEPSPPTGRVAPLSATRQIAFIHGSAAPDADMIGLLRNAGYEMRALPAHGALLVPAPALAILVETRWQALSVALDTIARLRANGGDAPIVAISPFVLRSIDRTSILRAGADEFLSRAMGPGELLQRLALAVHRRRSASPDDEQFDAPKLAPVVVRLSPRNGDVRDLADLAQRTVRRGSEDRVSVVDGAVLVELGGIGRRDASFFTDRIRGLWARRGLGTLHADGHEHAPPSADGASTPPRDTRARMA